MNELQKNFKDIAYKNEELFTQAIGLEDHAKLWDFAFSCSQRIFECNDINGDKKQTLLNTMLWNNISELLCCLDSLERGYEHTVLNNLRMSLEGFCLAFDIYKNDKTFQSYQNSNYNVCKSISFMSKYNEKYKTLGPLYGELSKISHQSRFEFVARQFTKPLFGGLAITHIKVIKDILSKSQVNGLLGICLLLHYNVELAEEINANFIELYFLEKTEGGVRSQFNIPEYVFFINFTEKLQKMLKKRI